MPEGRSSSEIRGSGGGARSPMSITVAKGDGGTFAKATGSYAATADVGRGLAAGVLQDADADDEDDGDDDDAEVKFGAGPAGHDPPSLCWQTVP